MMKIVASTEIDAPAEVVWGVLTDLPRFGEWNPFIRAASGSATVGGRIRVEMEPTVAGPTLSFVAKVLVCEPNKKLRWRGHLLTPWLGGSDHAFTIEPSANGRVRFEQRETFHGLLPRLAWRALARATRRSFRAMNEALKRRVENARPARPRAAFAWLT
jgi:hypothetical protein